MALTSARQHAMPHWRDEFGDFASHDALAALTFDRRPAWVWSIDGQRLLWSNGTGLMRLGVTSFSDAAGTELDSDSSLRKDLALAADTIGPSEAMVMIRLPSGNQFVPSPCRTSRIKSVKGHDGLLVIVLDAGLDAKFETAINNEALELLFSDDNTLAFVDMDPNGMRRLNLEERTVEAEARIALDRLVPPRRVQVDDGDGLDASSLAASGLSLAKEALDISQDSEEPEGPQLSAGALKRPADAATVSYKSRDQEPARKQDDGDARRAQSGSGQALSLGASSQLALIDGENDARRPVRFLWQTDASVRFLFVSNGLTQALGRGSDIVGETWHDVASRMGLDPHGRIGRSFRAQDTWSGLTAWWPLDGGDRVPVEMTALPVYSLDRKFQGFRGFGVIRPGDMISRQQFEARFPGSSAGADFAATEPRRHDDGLEEEAKVIPIRPDVNKPAEPVLLSDTEQTAFEEIATSLAMPDDADDPIENAGLSDIEADTIWDDDQDRSLAAAAELEDDDEHPADKPARPVMPVARPLELPPIVSKSELGHAASGDPLASEDIAEEDKSELLGEIASLRDQVIALTDQRDAALAQNSDLSALIDLLPSGSVGLDSDGQIITANAPAQTLLADPSGSVLGLAMSDLLAEGDGTVLAETMAGLVEAAKDAPSDDAANNPEPASIIVSGRRSGNDLLLTLRTVMETDQIGFIASLQDFSQWKRREGDLRAEAVRAQETSDQKSDFLAWVSHEIRTPLGAIIGFAEVLMEEQFGPIENKKYRDYARDIRSSGQHVLSLVNDLLDLSKIEAGYFEINVTEVAINDVIQECLTIMYPQANTKQVVLRTSLSQIVPDILADSRTMRQIILNLMSNSIKYTGSGGQVIVSSNKAEDGGVIIKVRDTGEGMSEEDLRLAMEPFQQLGTSAHASGTGLGLPLTKVLVEANEATFDIRSSEGEGTIATIVFPPASIVTK